VKKVVLLASVARGFIKRSTKTLDAIWVVAGWTVGVVVTVGAGVSEGDGVATGALVPVGGRVAVDVSAGVPGRLLGDGRTVGVVLGNGVSVIESSAANSAVGEGATFDDKISHGITPQ
jgi:hypothetical protein